MSFNILEYPADRGLSAANSELYYEFAINLAYNEFFWHSSVPVFENGLARNINVVLSNCRILPVVLQNISSFILSELPGFGWLF